MSERDELEVDYLRFTRERLPELAAEAGDWPIRFDHCFMRVCLDHGCGGRWYDRVPGGRGPAYKRATDDQLHAAVDVARKIEAGGRDVLVPLNAQSLRWRGKLDR